MKPSGPGFLFLERIFMVVSISSLLIGLFRLSNSSWFILGRLYILGTYKFPLDYWIWWHIVFQSILVWSFICDVCGNFSFISDFAYMSFFFFLSKSSKGFVDFITLFKNLLFIVLIFCIILLFSILFNSALFFIFLFFCWLVVAFVLLFVVL